MNLAKKNRKKVLIIIAIFLFFAFSNYTLGQDLSEFDLQRAELSLIKDIKSSEYINSRQKLIKSINKAKIDYSIKARFQDIRRLIREQKYNCAIYELNDLINEGHEISTCYELLGDIALKSLKHVSKVVYYYKLALQHDRYNYSAMFKLSKLYLSENKNILALEYLKTVVENTDDEALLAEIEKIIKNKFTPESRFESNNMYEILGMIYYKTGKINDSYVSFIKAIEQNPSDIYLKYLLANLFYNDNKINNAYILYNAILKEHPEDCQIKTAKAKILASQSYINAAYNEFRDILIRYPNSIQAKYGIFKIYENKLPPDKILSKIYFAKQNYSPNQDELRKFAQFLNETMCDKKGADLFIAYADKLDKEELERQLAIQKQKELEELKRQEQEKEQQRQIELERKKAEYQKEQEQIQKEKERLEKEKKALIQEEKEQKLQNEKLAKKARLNKQNTKKQQEIKEEKKEAIDTDKKIAIEKQKSINKDNAKYQKYKLELDKYLAIEPKNAQTYTAIANTYKLMEVPTAAIVNYKEALKYDPINSDLYYNLGLTYLELNSTQTSKTHLIKAIELDKNNTKASNLLSFVNQKIVTETINKAYSEFENKDYIKALDIFDKGLKDYPQNAQMYYYRALVYDAMKRNSAQISDLQKAIEFDPSYYMAYYQLGKAYEKINDERNALVAYERFLSIEPEEEELISEIQQKVITLGAKYY